MEIPNAGSVFVSNKRILIVDDDPDLLFLVAHSVKNLGADYQVSTAGGGTAALDQIQKQKFDLVVTDYMMPGLNGLELIQEMRRVAPGMQFILMTAHHDTNRLRDTVEGVKLGGFVGKPFTMPELLKVIRRVMAPTSVVADSEMVETSIPPKAIREQLQALRRQIGAHIVLLVNSDGYPLEVVGDTDRAKAARLAAFISANFLAVAELASLFGDNDSVFKSSYYEGNNYNIYGYDINGDFYLAVIFGAGGKPGTVWFYTKQTATALLSLLPVSEETPADNADTTLATDFDSLLGDEIG